MLKGSMTNKLRSFTIGCKLLGAAGGSIQTYKQSNMDSDFCIFYFSAT